MVACVASDHCRAACVPFSRGWEKRRRLNPAATEALLAVAAAAAAAEEQEWGNRPQRRQSTRQRQPAVVPPATSGAPAQLSWTLPSTPSLPQPVLSGVPSHAEPLMKPWQPPVYASTITTGTVGGSAIGPGIITTGVVTTGALGPVARAGSSSTTPPTTSAPASSITRSAPAQSTPSHGGDNGSGPAGSSVVTGCGRPTPSQHTLKRRRSNTGAAADAASLTLPCPAPGPMETFLSCRSGVTVTYSSSGVWRSSASAPSASRPAATIHPPRSTQTHGSMPQAQCCPGGKSGSESIIKDCGRMDAMVNGEHLVEKEVEGDDDLSQEVSGPPTPPRSPGLRAVLEFPPQPQPASLPLPQTPTQQHFSMPAALRQEPAMRMAFGGPCDLIGTSQSASASPLQLLSGFRMLGFEASYVPQAAAAAATSEAQGAAPKGQFVQIVLRLSPSARRTVQAEAPPLQQPQRTPQLPAQQLHDRQQQRRQQAFSAASAPQVQSLPPPSSSLPSPLLASSSNSSDGQPLESSSSSVTSGWLPAPASVGPSTPALAGLERLLSAAAAAAEAATAAAAPYVSCPSEMPNLPVPRPDLEAFFEPDGSLLRGAVLKTACALIRLVQLLCGGFSVSLPWADVDTGAAATAALATSAGSGSGRSGSTLVGRLPQSPMLTAAASGRRAVPLASVLRLLADFGAAARALQRAEAEAAGGSSGGVGEEYRALWPLMRRGVQCAEGLMVRVERILTGQDVGCSPLSSVASTARGAAP